MILMSSGPGAIAVALGGTSAMLLGGVAGGFSLLTAGAVVVGPAGGAFAIDNRACWGADACGSSLRSGVATGVATALVAEPAMTCWKF